MAIELTQTDLETLNHIREALGIATTKEVFPEATYGWNAEGYIGTILDDKLGTVVNFKSLASCSLINLPRQTGASSPVTTISGAHFLTKLENRGTESALSLNYNFQASVLNQFFTDLPAITNGRTVTINVAQTPGAATCNPSIATAKGYTIVTA